jgi:hypothetical protein
MTAWTRPEAVAFGTDQVFESLVSEKMLALGWQCEIVRAGDHFGADLICTQRGEKAVVQCTASARMDMGDLQHAAAVKSYHSADLALIVHGGAPAAPRAQALAADMGVAFVHVDELVVAGPYDRSEYGVRLRLERELALEQEKRSRQETENRLTLMAYYQAVAKFELDTKAWHAANRRHPWVKGMGVASIAPPFLLLGSPYFIIFLLLSLALAVYAVFFTAPGARPVAPAPLVGLTPEAVLPERTSPAFPTRPTLRERSDRSGVPAPATLVRHGRPQHGQVTDLKSIVKCPKCQTKMRLPRGKRLWANCPKCENRFRADT